MNDVKINENLTINIANVEKLFKDCVTETDKHFSNLSNVEGTFTMKANPEVLKELKVEFEELDLSHPYVIHVDTSGLPLTYQKVLLEKFKEALEKLSPAMKNNIYLPYKEEKDLTHFEKLDIDVIRKYKKLFTDLERKYYR